MDKIEHIDTSGFEYRHGYFIRASESRYLRLGVEMNVLLE